MSFIQNIPAKIVSLENLLRRVAAWRLEGRKIVFTNGVFDLMHQGHVDYLMKAADLGDVLIVGLNSDSSVKMLNKGPNRPIQGQDSRALVLSSFIFVSAVTIFEEATPVSLIEAVQPDVLVKGGDYKEDNIAGSKFVRNRGGQVVILPLLPGHSTTIIENKIRIS